MNFRNPILWIMLAVLIWGLYHAVGAYLLNHNPWRGVMVMGCSLAFLAFWGIMLNARRTRLERSGK
jgi:hypothetical protein